MNRTMFTSVPIVILRNVSDQGYLITLVTRVYWKTNVFITTVGTATPPEWKMGEYSPLTFRLQSPDNECV
jgi:hypothetical protein